MSLYLWHYNIACAFVFQYFHVIKLAHPFIPWGARWNPFLDYSPMWHFYLILKYWQINESIASIKKLRTWLIDENYQMMMSYTCDIILYSLFTCHKILLMIEGCAIDDWDIMSFSKLIIFFNPGKSNCKTIF